MVVAGTKYLAIFCSLSASGVFGRTKFFCCSNEPSFIASADGPMPAIADARLGHERTSRNVGSGDDQASSQVDAIAGPRLRRVVDDERADAQGIVG